jgi:hypothetical protein
MMAAVAKYRDDISGQVNTGGSSTAYTVASNQTYTSLADGIVIVARMHTANGASPTLNVDSLGAKAIRSHTSTAIVSGVMNSGGVYEFTYDSGDDCWYARNFYSTTTTEFADNVFRVQDNGDATKELAFEVSDITTGNTRTITVSDTDIEIEGNALYRVGGTDVPVTDGGTGASSAADARTNLGLATVDQSEAEAGTGTTTRAWTAQRVAQAIAAQTLVSETVQATTSGTEFDFTGIPAGVNRITVMLDQVSLSGTNLPLVQIGDSGGIESSGYVSVGGLRSGETTSTAGFVINSSIPATGILVISRVTGNTWVSSHVIDRLSEAPGYGAGRKALSAELDRVRLTRTGSDTFDGGQVNIFYE